MFQIYSNYKKDSYTKNNLFRFLGRDKLDKGKISRGDYLSATSQQVRN